jgi:O-antigen ligase
MRILLILIILIVTASDLFRQGFSLGPGLSLKNAVLYAAVTFLIFRFVLARNFKVQMGPVLAAQILVIIYAIASWLIVSNFVGYKDYNTVTSGISLKGNLIDLLLYFFLFLYGVTSAKQALSVLKVLLGMFWVVVFICLFDFIEIIDFEPVEPFVGRMTGLINEANQYGDFLVFILPFFLAAAIHAKWAGKLAWLACALATLGSIVLTGSRAALVGLIVASIAIPITLRASIPMRTVGRWAAAGLGAFGFVLLLASAKYGQYLYERIIGDTYSVDPVTASSGRTEMWGDIFQRMGSVPTSFLTGFGWDSYDRMGFRWTAHNTYFHYWFELGLIGIIGTIFSLTAILRYARSVIPSSRDEERAYLTAFYFGGTAIIVAAFFGELFQVWPYFWAISGLIMRVTLDTGKSQPKNAIAPSESIESQAASRLNHRLPGSSTKRYVK